MSTPPPRRPNPPAPHDPEQRRARRHRPPSPRPATAAALTVAVSVLLTASACGSPTTTSDDAKPAAADPTTGDASPAAPIDACALLTEPEVTQVIGAHRTDGRPGDARTVASCEWENPDTAHSISLSVNLAGTAANGTLPTEEPGFESRPGPDGIRFSSGGAAQFVLGDRVADIQVVSGAAGRADETTAVRLIGQVRSRF
ncbi:DUF3558 family protein [Plantactinospora sp. GCM10030261]|uniref:DUF3558 family protein n=1 Tax=Plantactinospora sp. GCM10030261 TaxID=3273420 RepID=UPI0036242A41